MNLNPFRRSYTASELDVFRFLKKTTVFKNLEYNELSLFIPYMYEREYQKDEVVFFRDDPSQALYIVKEGEVTFTIDLENEFEELTRIGSNALFGESCLIEGQRRLLNAIVTSETALLYVMPQASILSIFDNNIDIKAKMLDSYSRLLNGYNGNLFKAYRASAGFFNLGQMYKDSKNSQSKG